MARLAAVAADEIEAAGGTLESMVGGRLVGHVRRARASRTMPGVRSGQPSRCATGDERIRRALSLGIGADAGEVLISGEARRPIHGRREPR